MKHNRAVKTLKWKLFGAFLLQALLCGIGLLVLVFLFNTIFLDLASDLLYTALGDFLYYLLLDYRWGIVIVLYILMILLLIFFTIAKACRYVGALSAGVEDALSKENTLIKLPKALKETELTINSLKYNLLHNEQVAKEAEQRKNDLVVYLAHDIKTPLTSVIGYLSLLHEAPDMPANQRAKYIGITLEKAYRLEELINEFFDITRFNLQTIELDLEEIDLGYMLMQMADEFYPMLSPGNRKAEVHSEPGITVFADPDKLARVFNNIFKNAIAYSYPNTTIRITARVEGKWVLVCFADVGRVIAPEKLNHIFEKFYRLDSSRSTQTGGAGLGLAIAREIIQAHGGGITATSDESQTEFIVALPTPLRKS